MRKYFLPIGSGEDGKFVQGNMGNSNKGHHELEKAQTLYNVPTKVCEYWHQSKKAYIVVNHSSMESVYSSMFTISRDGEIEIHAMLENVNIYFGFSAFLHPCTSHLKTVNLFILNIP